MSNKYLKFIAFIIAVLILGFFFSSELTGVKNFFYKIFSPVAGKTVNFSSGIQDFFGSINSIKNLTRTNVALEKENNELNAKLAELKEVQHENEILKKELGFSEIKKDHELVPAKVIGRSSTSFFQTITIDKGKSDGIENGKAVLVEGYLIGTIQESGQNFSQVSLITNSQSLIAVILQDSRGTGILRGGLKGLTVEDIPLDTPVKIGETVVTSDTGSGILSGIAVGQVQDVISSQSEIFQRVNIKSPVELGKIEYVFVLNK